MPADDLEQTRAGESLPDDSGGSTLADPDLLSSRPAGSDDPGPTACASTAAGRPRPATVLRPPPSIGGYEILGELGRGGMGVVYHARRILLNRPCALKMILAGAHADHVASTRFLAEAEAVARLTHPNVVQIHAFGESDGLPYFELEYLPGGSLDKVLDGTPWHARSAAKLVEGLARGVAEAHRLGIVHRDLKPANILLAADDTPKITDFGLAKEIGAESGLTRTESVIGSPNYMAPEQAKGDNRNVGPSADIYALGAIYYELTTGRAPFKASSLMETLRLVRESEPVAPRKLVPDLPRDAETIALRCLEKDPGRRYGSAQALADDLRRFLDGDPIEARQPLAIERAWRWCRRNPSLAGLSAASALLLLALTLGSITAALVFYEQRQALRNSEWARDRADRDNKLALVDAALTSAPDGVPYIVASLRSSSGLALPVLKRHFDDPKISEIRRLRAAEILARLGEFRTSYLVARIESAPVAEGRNFVAAMAAIGRPAIDALKARFSTATDLGLRARLASTLLALGEPGPCRSMLAEGPDPTPRVRFVADFAAWHGDLAGLGLFISNDEAADVRSGLCLAVAEIPSSALLDSERAGLIEALAKLYRSAPDGGTHSASGCALRRWGVDIPDAPIAPSPAREWFVDSLGQTLIRLPIGAEGGVPANPGRNREIYLADRELTVKLYRRFLDDPATPRGEKPSWMGPNLEVSPTEDCPVNRVSLREAIGFCNWLSHREGRRAYYVRRETSPSGWACDVDADGYRIPTVGDWDEASRAGSKTSYFVGEDPAPLARYANILGARTRPAGRSSLPNDWGIFDLAGNSWEFSTNLESSDPRGSASRESIRDLSRQVFWRGGSFNTGVHFTQVGRGFITDIDSTANDLGFRVACGGKAPPADPVASPDALASRPGTEAIMLRGERAARAGDWDEAAKAFEAGLAIAPGEPQARAALACSQLRADDLAGYRRTCAEACRAIPRDDGPAIAWICAIGPGGLADPGRLSGLASEMASEKRLGSRGRVDQRTAAAVSYRLGRFEEAFHRIQEGFALDGGRPDPFGSLLLAMVYQRLGLAPEAHAWLSRGLAGRSEVDREPFWKGVEFEVLRREAEALISEPIGELPRELFAP